MILFVLCSTTALDTCGALFRSALYALLQFNATIPAVILFSGFFAYFVVTLTISEWRRKTRAQMVRQDNAASQVAMDSLNNFDLVKQFTNEVFETERYQNAVRRYQVSMYKTQTSLSLLNGLQQVIVGVTLGAILVVSARDVADGKYSVGRFVQLQTYTIQTFTPLSFLGTIYSAVISASPAAMYHRIRLSS